MCSPSGPGVARSIAIFDCDLATFPSSALQPSSVEALIEWNTIIRTVLTLKK
jgi:hypothetical protein